VYLNKPPTLLAAGLKDLLVTGSGKITVVMWPIVVDTVFTTGDTTGASTARTAASVVTDGKPGTVSLLPVEWGVTWTLRQGTSGNGLTALIDAQKKVDAAAGDNLLLKSKKTVVNGTESAAIIPAHTGNVITLDIGSYTSGIGKIDTTGSVNFKLEYVPFNLTASAAWSGIKAADTAFDLTEGGPVWILRNGVNDAAQNAATDFNKLGKAGYGSANGNGAAAFTIAAGAPGTPAVPNANGEYLLVKDGKFNGPDNSTTPKITFTTQGYTGNGKVYYAAAPAGDEPDPADYTLLDTVPAGEKHQRQITLKPEQAGGNYNVYIVVMKGGAVSAPLIINPEVNYEWGTGRFVAIAYANNKAAYSDNGGKTWTATTLPSVGYWKRVGYGGGVFVAVAYTTNKAAYSDNGGKTWTETTLPSSARWFSLAYGGGVFVAVTNNTNKAAYSDNGGKTWTATTLPSSADWRDVAYGEP
jgi:hypothetical protein